MPGAVLATSDTVANTPGLAGDLRTTSHICRSGEAFWSEALVPGSNMQLAGGPCVKGRCSGVPIVHLRPNTAVCFQRSPNGNKHSPFTCSGRRQCRCRGILDSYRAEQAAKDTKAKQLEQHRQAGIGGVQMLVYDSVDEDACPAECVMEVFTAPQFKKVCQDSRDALVVVDFYKTSCGACKYMMNGYFKLCKATYSADEHPDVVFLKHNVHDDELGESTDLAKRLGIRGVPKFMLFRNMELLEEFSTRDQDYLIEAVRRHADIEHLLE